MYMHPGAGSGITSATATTGHTPGSTCTYPSGRLHLAAVRCVGVRQQRIRFQSRSHHQRYAWCKWFAAQGGSATLLGATRYE